MVCVIILKDNYIQRTKEIMGKSYKLTDKQFDDLWGAINKQAIDDYMTLRRRHIPKSQGFDLKELEDFFVNEYPNDIGKEIFGELKENCNKLYGKHITQKLSKNKLEMLKKKEEELEKIVF